MKEHLDPDFLMGCRSLFRITGRQMVTELELGAPDCCVFGKKGTPVIPAHSSLFASPAFKHSQREEGRPKMNEGHWQIPKPLISDHPPTSQQRQRDKKKPSHIPARKKARESLRDESCVSCYSHSSSFSSSFYFDLRAELLQQQYEGLRENNKAYQEIKPLAT